MKERINYSGASMPRPAKYAIGLALSLALTGCSHNVGAEDAPSASSEMSARPSPAFPEPAPPPPEISSTPEPALKAPQPTPDVQPTPTQPPETLSPKPSPSPSPEPAPSPEPSPSPEPAPSPSPSPTQTTPEATPTPKDHAASIDCLASRCIALTFDDGPGPYTEQLLSYLDGYDAKATFFMVGSRVQSYAPVVRDVQSGGHQLGNHSWKHDRLTDKSPAAAAADIERTNDAIAQVSGVTPDVMRPPYGSTNQTMIEAIDMPEITWSVDTEDWKYRDSEYVADYVIDHAERGDIVLMHDIHPTSVEAVPEILESLTADGYELVTVDTLLGGQTPPTGVYRQQAR